MTTPLLWFPSVTAKIITATDAARNFSEILNQVKYQSARFDVMRGREVVARIVPAGPAAGLAIVELDRLIARLPALDERDGKALEKELKALRKRLRVPTNPWGS